MKKYLKTPEEVISALKEGKTVYSSCGEYRMIDGFIVYEGGGICNINANLTLLESPFVKEAEPLKIEVGKFYKTKGGEKARCYILGDDRAFFGECMRCKNLFMCSLLAADGKPLTKKKAGEICKTAGGFKQK